MRTLLSDGTAYISLKIELISSYAQIKIAARTVVKSCNPGDRQMKIQTFEIRHKTWHFPTIFQKKSTS